MQKTLATFGAGCFWGVEEAFRNIPGVLSTEVGYMGGSTDHPTYQEVCSSRTGHAEVVHIVFDADLVSYKTLLDIFWKSHNPTTMNRQGPDIGSQYRSVIFYYSEEQKALAEQSKEELEKSHAYADPVITQIVPAEPFYLAEAYHQQYLAKRGRGSCHI